MTLTMYTDEAKSNSDYDHDEQAANNYYNGNYTYTNYETVNNISSGLKFITNFSRESEFNESHIEYDYEDYASDNGDVSHPGNETEESCNSYTDAELSLRLAWLLLGYPILVLGIVGHLLGSGFLIHAAFSGAHRSGRRRFALPPVAVYLLPLSACGLTALLSGLLPSLVVQQTCYRILLLSSHEAGLGADLKCRIGKTLQYYSLQLYAWLTACIAVERACAFFRPHEYRRFFRGRGAEISVCACALGLLALNAIPFVAYGVDEDGCCHVRNAYLMNDIYVYVDYAMFSVLPLTIMTPCNVFVMSRIVRSQQQKRHDSHAQSTSSATRRALPLAVASLSMNVALLLTVLPVTVELYLRYENNREAIGDSHGQRNGINNDSQYSAHYIINFSRTDEPVETRHSDLDITIRAAWCAGLLASYLFSSSCFYVYLVVSVRFRHSAKLLLLAAAVSLGSRRGSTSVPADSHSRKTSLTTSRDATLSSHSTEMKLKTFNADAKGEPTATADYQAVKNSHQ